MARRRPSGSLEAEVMAVLAGAERPMSAAQVREALSDALAYTTVMTVLTRLADKGLAIRQRRGRAHVYAAVRDEAEVTAHRMRRIMDAGEDRVAALARFVDTLSDDEEAMLLGLLHGTDRDNRP
ncbi:MAG TPA: BlaI/MecI/CopY family transcriptional regulator [Micromonosporaceae bacterium]|nr:BlaI/MecI/CopY family transcriptional regulator [Micromonosporaceae bacterium]